MALLLIEIDEVPDAALPLAELAAQMRLADGTIDDPAQAARLRARLRAAIDDVERRTGRALARRTAVLAGAAGDARRIALPVTPVARIVEARVRRGAADVPLGAVALETGVAGTVALLGEPVGEAELVTLVLEVGPDGWAAVPPGLRQAVLLIAEALDAGEGPALTPMAERLLAAHRPVRIGGARR